MSEEEYRGIMTYKANRDELIEDVKELRNHWAELESYIRYKIYANPSNSQYKNVQHEMDRIKGGIVE
ncbi:hypothetical protein AMC75_03485 [Staphylococcus carnosus]|nr:hypothetical protein AMC75_03485 [Staphylococcus carnosus]